MNSWFEIPKSLFCEETQRFQFYAAGCVCVCLFVCACACLCVRAPACACLRVCVFCVCLCVCLCVCVCVCVCVYTVGLSVKSVPQIILRMWQCCPFTVLEKIWKRGKKSTQSPIFQSLLQCILCSRCLSFQLSRKGSGLLLSPLGRCWILQLDMSLIIRTRVFDIIIALVVFIFRSL